MIWSRSVDVSGLRPWEWAAMDAHDYYRIVEIRHAWDQGRADYRADQAAMKKQGKTG